MTVALGLASGVLALRAPGQEVDHCKSCHPEVSAAELGRPHELAGIRCTDCHGGDSTRESQEEGKASSTGFRAGLDRQAVVEICGRCHSDVGRMNSFGIPTDQLARYLTSRHGKALFDDSSEDTATCSDCHGSHGIQGPEKAESPVHPKNVPATCGRCHSDPGFAERTGLRGDVGQLFVESVHGDLLLLKGDASAPQCATCHDSHGSVPSGFGEVSAVCGKCHVEQEEFFLRSPHAPLLEQGEFAGCVVCHGDHHVLKADPRIFDRICKLCHEEGQKAVQVRQALQDQLRLTKERFEQAERKLALGFQKGIATPDDQVLLESARAALERMAPAQHSLSPELLQPIADEAATLMGRLDEILDAAATRETRKRAAILPVVLFFVLMSLGFFLRFRRIHRTQWSEGDEG